MKVLSVAYPEKDVCEMTFTATAEELETGAAAVYEATRDTYTIRGFEKGQANREEIEADRGEHVFWYDAINNIMDEEVPALYKATVEELNLDVVSEVTYDLVNVKKEEGFTASAKFCLRPELTVKKHKGFVVKCTPNVVEDKEVDHFLQRKQRLAAELVPHKGPAVKGNIIHVTFKGICEGEEFPGGTRENIKLTLGAGQMVPGFEDAVIGHKGGDEFDIDVTFPANWRTPVVAGKKAVFHVNLIDCCVRQLPAINCDFAKKMGGVDTMEEYRADVRKQLEGMKRDNAMARAKAQVVASLAAETEGALPEPLLAQAYTSELRQIQEMIQMQQSTMQRFLEQIKMTKEVFAETIKKTSEEKLRVNFALYEVAKMENLMPTEEELNEAIEKRAEAQRKTVEEFLKTADRAVIAEGIGRERAAQFVIENSTIEE